jgi:hypothetical protein
MAIPAADQLLLLCYNASHPIERPIAAAALTILFTGLLLMLGIHPLDRLIAAARLANFRDMVTGLDRL